ncbi:unnamed protein product [Prunus armeniaca]
MPSAPCHHPTRAMPSHPVITFGTLPSSDEGDAFGTLSSSDESDAFGTPSSPSAPCHHPTRATPSAPRHHSAPSTLHYLEED